MSADASAARERRRPPRVLPPELPRVVRTHTPSRCTCADCGSRLRKLGEDISEQLDYVPGYFQVIRHVRPKLTCVSCARIVQTAAPTRPIERGLPTAALLAQVVGCKVCRSLSAVSAGGHLSSRRRRSAARNAGVVGR